MTLFLLAAFLNLAYVFRRYLYGKRESLVLIAGGIAGLAGFLILPIPALNHWFWLPPLADIGLPYAAGLALFAAKKLRRR